MINKTSDFADLSRNLLDSFFLREDQQLIQNLRTLQALKKSQEELANVSGIKNEEILKKLVQLDIRPETLSSLSIIPLIEVAWADGDVDEVERKAILNFLKKDSPEYGTVAQWLIRKPDEKLFEAWAAYIKGLCEQLSKDEKRAFKASLMQRAHHIASASGGLLGIGKISTEEKDMFKKLEAVFGK